MSDIDPKKWHKRCIEENPRTFAVTEWFSGTVAPFHHGIYERCFIDGIYTHYFDGIWRSCKGGTPHWRQVGHYPAWRGLNQPKEVYICPCCKRPLDAA